jgi:hypothetical protein
MNLDDIGISTIKDSTAFKKIQFFSKTNPTNLFNVKSDFQNSLNNLNSMFLSDLDLNQSYTYGMDRQHTFTSLAATLPSFTTLMDKSGVNKFLSYTLNQNITNTPTLNLNRLDYSPINKSGSGSQENLMSLYNKILPSQFHTYNSTDFSFFLKLPNLGSILSAESDSKQYPNLFKFILNPKHKKKSIQNFNFIYNNIVPEGEASINHLDPTNSFSTTVFNTENTLKFKDYKSSNAQFLGSERTVRLLNNINSNSYRWNTSASPNLTSTLTNNLLEYGTSQNYLYSASLSNWADFDKYVRFSNNTVWMPSSHSPIMSNNPYFTNTSFDFFSKGKDDVTPMVLRSKEESAPIHTFNTYWSSYWALSNFDNRTEAIQNSYNLLNKFYFPFFTEYAEYVFRNWSSIELMEDVF